MSSRIQPSCAAPDRISGLTPPTGRASSPLRALSPRALSINGLQVAALSLLAGPLVPGAFGQSPAPGLGGGAPQATTQVAGGMVPGGTGSCPPGSQQVTDSQIQCYPGPAPTCDGPPALLDWFDKPLNFQKFDPSLGTLVRVEVDMEADFTGSLCYVNPTDNCCTNFNWNANAGHTIAPSPANNPPLTITPFVFPVAASNGPIILGPVSNDSTPDDCMGADGTCDGGNGGLDTIDVSDGPPTAIIDDPTDLASWILGTGSDRVTLLSSAVGGLNTTGCINVDPTPDFRGRAKVEVRYVYCTNAPPICGPDMAVTVESTPVDIAILANDSDPEGMLDCGSVVITTGPTNGVAQIGAGCNGIDCGGCLVTYTPDPGFCGKDTFVYEVSDADGATTAGCEVEVDVDPINEPPVAVDDFERTSEDTPVVIMVCMNDSDPDELTACGAPLDCRTVQIVSPPDCGGTADVNADGSVTFTPPPGYCGMCEFTYTVRDTQGLPSNIATVTVSISALNDCPVAVDDTATTPENQAVLVPVCFNDSDPDEATGCGAPLDCSTVTITMAPGCGGTAVPNGAGDVLFTPPAGFCGECVFRYEVSDSAGCVSNVAKVTVTVTPENDCPTALDDSAQTPEDQAVLINVCMNDSDPDDANGCGGLLDCTTVTVLTQPDCGGMAQAQADGRVLFTPPAGFCGICQFTYRVFDEANCASNVATVTVSVMPGNDCPIAVDDSANTMQGTPVVIPVCSNDSDPDEANRCGAPLDCSTVVIVQDPNCAATAVPTGDGNVTFTPGPGTCGTCVFRYRVSDMAGCMSNAATVTVEVFAINACPSAFDDAATTPEDQPVDIPVCANDSDPDDGTGCGAPLDCSSIEIVQMANCGGATMPMTNGNVSFVPPPDFCGDCWFTYRVYDMDGCVSNVATVTVTVTPTNDPPFAVDDKATTEIETPVVIDVCINDGDPDDAEGCAAPLDCSSTMMVDPPDCGGTVTMNGDGTVTFTPPPGFCGGECVFTYRVFDAANLPSNEASVRVTVFCEECDTPNRRNPGSLLLFPEFDNRVGVQTLFTVTYAGVSGSPSEVWTEFVYIDENGCEEFNRSEELTKNDTLTLVTSHHNPNMERGYAYVFARCGSSQNSPPVVHNRLIGNLFAIDGVTVFSWSTNPVTFMGIGEGGGECNGFVTTDVDNDGIRDLNGIEYEPAPDELLVPRFIGQSEEYRSDLILVALSGGAAFETWVDFLVYNDNEEAFSTELVFDCWTRRPLLEISNLFSWEFLALGTNDDPDEVVGDRTIESGWFRLDGGIAQSNTTVIDDPAFYAVLVESVGEDRYVADLPFERCTQTNGDLLPRSINGDDD